VQIIESRKDIFGSNTTTGGRLTFPSVAERAMCKKCGEIEKTIQHYRRIERTIVDQVTVDRTKELIADLQAERDAPHSE